MADEFNKEIKSNRLLQSLRYTAAAQDNQEAYTNVFDLNASEIYTQENYIPTSSLPYNDGSSHLKFITASIDGSDANIAQYYFEVSCSKSSRVFGNSKSEIWFVISGSGFSPNPIAGIDSIPIDGLQQTNWLSNKYLTASLSLKTADETPTGYNVRVKINGSNVSAQNYQFDYKTGVLQFISNTVSPNTTDAVTLTGYRYVGQTLNEFISTGGGGGTPGGATTQVQFNDGGAFGGSERLTFNKTTGLTQLSGSFEITGSVNNIFLIKSGSIDLLRMSSSGALVFGDLQHTPPPVVGGMFYSASNFYVGTE